DRKPGPRKNRWVTTSGHTLLVVPKTDERTRGVSVVTYRMRVFRAIDLFFPHGMQDVSQYFVAGASRMHTLQSKILKSIRILQSLLDPGGDIRLAFAEHITHVLRIGIQAKSRDAEVCVQNIAAFNDYAFFPVEAVRGG